MVASGPMYEALRELFPICQRYLYFDHASVAPTSTRVLQAQRRWIEDLLRHGGVHEEAWEAEAERARALCARLLGARPDQIAFVRNTSHGLALAAEGLPWQAGDAVAFCREVEYPSNVYPWERLAERGVRIQEVPAVRGGLTSRALAGAIDPSTRLIATSSVQYASGHRTDLAAVAALCRDRDILLCVDGIQSVGAAPIDVAALGIDFLAADGHKWLLGTAGTGLLYVSDRALERLRPPLVGWKSTTGAWNFDVARLELRTDAAVLEEGSPNYAGIYGLAAAVDLLLEVGVEAIQVRLTTLLTRLAEGLVEQGFQVSPGPDERAGILTARRPDVDTTRLAERLHADGVRLSSRRGRLRISPHFYNTEQEVDRLLESIAAATPTSP